MSLQRVVARGGSVRRRATRSASLAGHGLLLARLVGVVLGRLQEPARLLAQLGRVLVAMRGYRMLSRGLYHLVLLADDCQRAVHVARPAPAVRHYASHACTFRRDQG